ncbi:acyl-CoA dehydrogenase [Actinacidiphila sp. ITFR-21]|uniref:acyl-CoA dehydrogenase family protein n=1 Tax=Actinacidiphila sp. ITFR-21 TaxID=3075199 RepID=UPI002889B1F2|nr:acyl-CoA dehydrogenase [Streptomyces sp. ITFR-21]WNI17072.1 acyl-CoA dehydrogenase [Streptomyces sp. ITFR-21]
MITNSRDELTRALFGDEHADLHGPWRKLVSTEPFRRRDALTPAQRTALSYERLRLVNEHLADPADFARDPAAVSALHEWTAVVDAGLTTVAGIHYNLFLGSLLDHGPAGARDLGEFTSMRQLGTFLCTEVDHGNDAAAMETTATLQAADGTFVLHTPSAGAQKFMPNTSTAGGPKTAVVAARLIADGTDHGVFLFLVPLSGPEGTLPGVRVRPLPTRVGAPVDHCLTAFDQVLLPADALLAAGHGSLDPDGTFRSTLGSPRKRFLRSIARVTTGKLCMSAAALGGTRTALTVAVRYGHLRHIGGGRKGERVPLFAHHSHAAPLTRALAAAYAMTAWHREVVAAWCSQVRDGGFGGEAAERETVEREIAVAKGWITWRCRDLTTEARERCGAQGLLEVNGISERAVDIEGTITAEGDNLVIWAKAAGEMIFGHTAPPLAPPAPRGRPVTDPELLTELLAATEHLWHERARTRLRGGPSRDPLGRWNTAAGPALRLVDAYGARRAAQALRTAAQRARLPRAARLLDDLHTLFALQQVTAAAGDLLAAERMTADQVRALPDAVDAVTARLVPHAQELADAFDVPQEWLADLPVTTADLATAYDDPDGAWHRTRPTPVG